MGYGRASSISPRKPGSYEPPDFRTLSPKKRVQALDDFKHSVAAQSRETAKNWNGSSVRLADAATEAARSKATLDARLEGLTNPAARERAIELYNSEIAATGFPDLKTLATPAEREKAVNAMRNGSAA